MFRTIAKRLGILRFYPFIILLLPFIALGIVIIFVNATVSGLFLRARWLRELRKQGRATRPAVLLSAASRGTLIVDRPGFNFKVTHCWWTDENLAEIAPMPIPTDAERLNFCTETKETTPHEFDLWCWQRYLSPTTGSAVLVTPPHHGEAIASKIREHLPSLSCVTSWSAIAAMQTATGNATEQCDEPKSR
jgi:hypothetical protein